MRRAVRRHSRPISINTKAILQLPLFKDHATKTHGGVEVLDELKDLLQFPPDLCVSTHWILFALLLHGEKTLENFKKHFKYRECLYSIRELLLRGSKGRDNPTDIRQDKSQITRSNSGATSKLRTTKIRSSLVPKRDFLGTG